MGVILVLQDVVLIRHIQHIMMPLDKKSEIFWESLSGDGVCNSFIWRCCYICHRVGEISVAPPATPGGVALKARRDATVSTSQYLRKCSVRTPGATCLKMQ